LFLNGCGDRGRYRIKFRHHAANAIHGGQGTAGGGLHGGNAPGDFLGALGGGFDVVLYLTRRQARKLASKARQHVALMPKRPTSQQQANHEARRLTSSDNLPRRRQTGLGEQEHHGKGW